MIDVSDGLDADLARMLEAGELGAEIDLEALPLSPEIQRCASLAEAQTSALQGGEDYELCFTVAPSREAQLMKASQAWDVPVTRLGEVSERRGLRWLYNGKEFRLPGSGFEHFDG